MIIMIFWLIICNQADLIIPLERVQERNIKKGNSFIFR